MFIPISFCLLSDPASKSSPFSCSDNKIILINVNNISNNNKNYYYYNNIKNNSIRLTWGEAWRETLAHACRLNKKEIKEKNIYHLYPLLSVLYA